MSAGALTNLHLGNARTQLEALMDPALYIGCASLQTEEFIRDMVDPVLAANKHLLGMKGDVHV